MEPLPHCSGSAARLAVPIAPRSPRRRCSRPRCRTPSTSRPPRLQPLRDGGARRAPGRARRARRDARRAVRLGIGRRRRSPPASTRATARRSPDALRRLRRRVFVHTLARDLTGRAEPRRSLRRHDHARRDARCARRVALHHRALAADFGEPRDETGDAQELVIVGMGKLGGRELNVSSDIDLVFVYPDDGETDGAAHARQSRVLRAARPARHRRAARDHAGRLRVPRRHAASPLRRKRAAGGAVLGARAVPRHAGSRVGALRVAQGARADRRRGTTSSTRWSTPFVFRKYLDYDAYDGLRDIHRQIARAGQAQRLRAEHQARPGRHPRDRVHRAGAAARARRTRARLARARHAARARRRSPSAGFCRRRRSRRCATPTSSCAMSSTGCSIATTSRRRRCPSDDRGTRRARARDGLRRLSDVRRRACRASRGGLGAVRRPVRRRATATRQRGDRPARAIRPRDDADARRSPRCGAMRVDDEQARRRRSRRPATPIRPGSSRISRASARARGTCSCRRCRGSASTRSCRSCSRPRPPQPDGGADAQTVFHRLFGLLETVSRRSAYLALLIEHPPMLPRLAQLMGASQWAADYLTRHPILLDELLDRARAAGRARLGRVAHRARAHAGRRTRRRRRAADGRAAPLPARADRFACSRRISPAR